MKTSLTNIRFPVIVNFIEKNNKWKYLAFVFLFFLVNVNAYAGYQKSIPIGTISGTFSVDGSGAATYQVPIEVPPGTNGVAPSLALNYNNQRSNGYLGMGWAVSGISSITRCPGTYRQTGAKSGVTFTELDRFCLDGVQLIALEGDYGKDGTVYHTEKETWTKIISLGKCGTGPCSFEAYNKDGGKLEFGTTTGESGSRIPVQGKNDGTVRVWSIDRYTDLNGNYTGATYFNDLEKGEYYITRLDYTGNEKAGLKPRRSVRFEYEDRNDNVFAYIVGSKTLVTKRFKGIKTYIGQNLVLDYRLSYEYSPSTRRSRLISLQQCDSQGICLPETRFTWQGKEARFNPGVNQEKNKGLVQLKLLPMDINNDGRTDLVQPWEKQGDLNLLTFLANANGFNEGTNQKMKVGSFNSPTYSMDVNGDNRPDLVQTWNSGGKLNVITFLAKDTGFHDGTNQVMDSGLPELPIYQLDIDGDNRMDLVQPWEARGELNLLMFFSEGKGFSQGRNQMVKDGSVRLSFFTMDVNGDGRSDLIQPWEKQGKLMFLSFLSNGKGFEKGYDIELNEASSQTAYYPIDVNGDGRSDIVQPWNKNGKLNILTFLSDGKGVTRGANQEMEDGAAEYKFFPMDVNGDGKSDLVLPWNKQGKLSLLTFLSYGKGFGHGIDNLFPEASVSLEVIPMDVNGDGRSDIVQPWTRGGKLNLLSFLTNYDEFPDLLTSITNGLKGNVSIDYAPLTDKSVYQREKDAQYPVVDIQKAMYVVKKYTNSDGRGDKHSYSYNYTGLKSDVTGVGLLGFKTIKMISDSSKRSSVITYRQDYPFHGSMEKNDMLDKDGNLLIRRAFEYLNLNSPQRQKNIYQVLPSKETMTHFTGRKKDYSLVKEFQYDEFGSLNLLKDLGDPSNKNDDLYRCTRYVNKSKEWRLGYIDQVKASKTLSACENFLAKEITAWDLENDLSWQKKGYDNHMNVVLEGAWNDKWIENTYKVDPFGNMVSLTDPRKNTVIVTYEKTYHTFPETITSPPNQNGVKLVNSLEYEPHFGTETQYTDANNRVHYFEVDGFGRSVNTYGPDPSGNKTLISKVTPGTDAKGIYVKTEYLSDWKENDWLWEKTYYDGLERKYRTEKKGVSDDMTIIEEIEFNEEGLIEQQSLPYFKKDAPSWIRTEYDAYNRPVLSIEPDGTRQKIDYYRGGLKISRTFAYGTPEARTEINFYDLRGNLVGEYKANGLKTDYTYDKLNRMTGLKTSPDVRTVSLNYDPMGNVIHQKGSDTGITRFEYDDAGNLLKRLDAEGNLLTFEYDALSRAIRKTSSLIAADGQNTETITTFVYDEGKNKGNVTTVTLIPSSYLLPKQSWTYRYGYDAYDQVVSEMVETPIGVYSYTAGYDPMGRIRKSTYPDGSSQVFTYAADGNIHTLSLDDETYVRYERFNALGEAENIYYKNGTNITKDFYPYSEGMGKLKNLKVLSGKQEKTLFSKQYKWNRLNGVTEIKDLLAVKGNVKHRYNEVGYLAKSVGPFGTETNVYDKLGNIIRKNDVINNFQAGTDKLEKNDKGVSYGYYKNGNLKQKTEGGVSWQYLYDGESMMVRTLKGDQAGTAFYNHLGERIYYQPVGGENKTYYVFPDYEITDYGSGKTLNTRYIEGLFGKAVSITDEGKKLAGAIGYHNTVIESGLDGMTKGLGALTTSVGNAPALFKYKIIDLFSRSDTVYSIRTGIGVILLAGALLMSLMILLAAGSPNSFFGKTRRIVRNLLNFPGIENEEKGGFWTSTEYSRKNPFRAALIPIIIAIYICTPMTLAEAALSPGANGAGNPEKGTFYFVQDQVNSVISVTDEEGLETASVAYLPFGLPDQPNSKGVDNFRRKFSGKQWDPDNRFYYFGARYYDPEQGRFTTPDPANQYINPYLYASNSPASYIDPDGREAATVAIIIVGAVVGSYAGAAAVNHDVNPFNWNWQSGNTWGGLLAGAAIGAITGGASVFAAKAGVAMSIVGDTIIGAGDGAAFTALGGGSSKEIFEAAIIGGITGSLLSGMDKMLTRFARKAPGYSDDMDVPSNSTGCSVSFSFPKDTPIAAKDGAKDIEDIEVGDLVWSYDVKTGKNELRPVSRLFTREAPQIITINTDKGEVKVTEAHPFHVDKKGWIPSEFLEEGDSITSLTGKVTVITSLEKHEEQTYVHNFEVQGNHNYFVSEAEMLVHNGKGTRTCTFEFQAIPGEEAEFQSQLDDQLDAMNNMDLDTLRANRITYLKTGRTFKQFTTGFFKKHFTRYPNTDEAWLHNPDEIAGGDHLPTTIGSKKVNSSIGAQWKGKNINKLDQYLKKPGKIRFSYRLYI